VAPIDDGGLVPTNGGGQIDEAKWLQWSRGLGAPPNLVMDQALAYAGVTRADLPAPPASAARASTNADPYHAQAPYYEVARRQSNRNFVVMPNAELLRGEVARDLGGNSVLLIAHPIFGTQGRAPGQPLVEDNAPHGHVYPVDGVADLMQMAHRENILIYMPHPRSKGSAGFPDANDRGIGFRGGWVWMGPSSGSANIAACRLCMERPTATIFTPTIR
jgi:hypothetical protein